MIHTFVPTHVGPSKLDLLLANAPELSDENKEKVTIITDLIRLYKLMGFTVTPAGFYNWYEQPLYQLQSSQHDLQIHWNTLQYKSSIQGADF